MRGRVMRRSVLRIVGVMFLVSMLAIPATVAAATPQITITPTQGPNGTAFVLTGAGFTANTTYYLRIAAQDGSGNINIPDPSVKSTADGFLLRGFSFGSNTPAITFIATIASAPTGGQVLATTTFTLTGPNGAKPGPQVVITPSEGQAGDPPGGTRFAVTGTGFAPNSTYNFRVSSEDRTTVLNFGNADITSDELGVLLSVFNLAGARPAGVYIAEVLSKGATPTVVASATFRVTSGATAPSPSPSATPAPSLSATPSPSPSATPAPSPSASPRPSATPAPSPSASPTPTPRPSPSPSPRPTPLPSPSPPAPPPTGNGGFLPGLPNTGGGGMASAREEYGVPLLGLGIVVGTVVATYTLRRRAA